MRCKIVNRCSFGAVLHYMPHNALRYTISASLACAANASKHAALTQASGHKPRVDGIDPIWNGDRPNMPAFADQINNGPMVAGDKQCPALRR